MKNTIFYYSGTGNSLWTAKKIAENFENSLVLNMTDSSKKIDSDMVGFVFPVHMWGVPRRVIKFIQQIKLNPSVYFYAIAVNAGQVSRTLIQFKNLLNKKGIALSLGYEIVLPSNYIPWGGPGSDDLINGRIESAAAKIKMISKSIQDKKVAKMERGPLWQLILFTLLYKLSFSHVPRMDQKFFIDEKCTGCGTCAKVCITNNIKLVDQKPTWNKNCEQCLACIQWCPEKAIQYGPKTAAYKRYHHPAIKLTEMLIMR